jgi:hypothetical protein
MNKKKLNPYFSFSNAKKYVGTATYAIHYFA